MPAATNSETKQPETGTVGPQPRSVGNFRWVICALLFIATTVNYIDRQVIGLLKPILAQEFRWTETDYANMRVSVSTIAKDGQPSPGAGERITRSIALKEQRELREQDGKVWYSYSQPASGGSAGSTITFWHVGFGAHMIVVSGPLPSATHPALTIVSRTPRSVV